MQRNAYERFGSGQEHDEGVRLLVAACVGETLAARYDSGHAERLQSCVGHRMISFSSCFREEKAQTLDFSFGRACWRRSNPCRGRRHGRRGPSPCHGN